MSRRPVFNRTQQSRLTAETTFERPSRTITDMTQTREGIQEKLDGYEEVPEEDVVYIPIGSHVRYLTWDKVNRHEKLCFGGFVKLIQREYLILIGKEGLTFSVQRYTKAGNGDVLHTTRFFKKMPKTEILQQKLDTTLKKSSEIINRQNEIIQKQKQEIVRKPSSSSTPVTSTSPTITISHSNDNVREIPIVRTSVKKKDIKRTVKKILKD